MNLQQALDYMKPPFTPAELQLKDIAEAAVLGRYLFAYDVGVGKTFVSTVVATMWDHDHTIIVGPPILNTQWAEWLKSVNHTDAGIYAGPKRTTDLLNHKWVVMSHAIWRDSFDTIREFYKSRDVCLIVDESQALKNPASKLFRTVHQFIAPDRSILMLTATPTSKPEDTYSYIKVKSPDAYRSFGHWQNCHVAERDIFGTITKYARLDDLADTFAIRMVKRTKKEMYGNVMEPIYQPMPYHLDPGHLKLYNKLAEEQLLLLSNGDKIDATTAQRLRHALQQIVVNYSKFSGNPEHRSKAYDIIDEVIEEVQPMEKANSKLAIWTYYTATSASVTAYLKEKFGDKAVVAAYGKVNSQKAIDAIMNDDDTRILVAQPSSCGVGLNLQHVCSEMLFIEMSTTPMQIRQAIGRVDRVGQKVRPTIRFAQALKTIQVKLFRDLLANDELVTKVERSITSLRDEIFGKD